VTSRGWLGWSLAQRGEFEEALEQGRAAIALAEEVGHPYSLVHAYYNLGSIHEIQGDSQQAGAVLERGLSLARELGFVWLVIQLSSTLGPIRVGEGRVTEGLALLERALEAIEEEIFSGPFTVPTLIRWGHAQLRAGRGPEARDTAMRAVTLARDRDERGNEAEALYLLGATTASPPAAEAALVEGQYREALASARVREMRPVVAHCELGLGRLYRRTGDAAKAQDHLTTSATMYREMGMGFWLEQAEAALGPRHGKPS
jgi:tetratricopeptide (TPR) repeat protein